ncbi:hypothetical protein [Paracoccus sp. SSJ]|jgi:hypothetical protein|uniref:hypothetical protein n=1 Tax=Paracoccus sp. SSJ TaxID=3050636 RepID=UPI002550F373|nr:hypothetical protein [Paracoccus sp. SSJ]MDK8874218.1 hypothetical protein [Paracoccus sp. SSJ]
MRFPGLSIVATAAIAAALSAPAAAQEWHARETPLISESGALCLISSGEALPHVAFTFERERTRFGLIADAFFDRNDIREYHGTLPSGASLRLSLGSDPSSPAAVLDIANRETGLRFLEHFLVSGDFSLTGNGVHIEIPALPSASSEMENLHHCLRELDNG